MLFHRKLKFKNATKVKYKLFSVYDFNISIIFFLVLSFLSSLSSTALSSEKTEEFQDFEIRVIRPRYFSKRNKFELGTQAVVVTNQTFIYTYMLSGLLTYHIGETIGIELSATFGTSIDKEDKENLESQFNIKTQIIRTKLQYAANLLWTPIYGKYQLSSGKLIYFDTYLSGGLGSSGVEYTFDHCIKNDSNIGEIKDNYTKFYGTLSVGLGQRFFINRTSSIKWDLRNHSFNINSLDGGCLKNPNADSLSSLHSNLTVHFGYSNFF